MDNRSRSGPSPFREISASVLFTAATSSALGNPPRLRLVSKFDSRRVVIAGRPSICKRVHALDLRFKPLGSRSKHGTQREKSLPVLAAVDQAWLSLHPPDEVVIHHAPAPPNGKPGEML